MALLTPEMVQRVEQALSNLEQSSDVWQDFVTFAATTPVQTENGPIPSLRALIENHQFLITDAIANLKDISTVMIDPTTKNMIVTYSNGQSSIVGQVSGEAGEAGVSVVNVELFEDPTEQGAVFFQTELSNGVVLRTQQSISGYNGKSISAVYLVDNHLLVVLEGGVELEPIPISGLTPISVVGATISNGELFINLSNGTSTSAGLAEALRGRGIANVRKVNDKVEVAYSDAPTTYVEVGSVNGLNSLTQVADKLIATYDSDPTTPVVVGTMTSMVGATISEAGNLIILTNAEENNQIDLGPVTALKPKDGASITAVAVVDNSFVVHIDGVPQEPIPVANLTPANIVGADVRNGILYFNLSDGREIEAGVAEELKGAGVASARLDPDGKLYFFYSDAPTTAVQVGVVPGIASMLIDNGRLVVRYTTAPTVPVDIGSMLSVTNVRLDGSQLIVTLNNGMEGIVGTIKSMQSVQLTNDVLSITWNDGVSTNLGNVRGRPGETGPRGIGITEAVISPAGDLILSWSDGSPDDNLGRVRADVLNYIGKSKWFSPASGDDTVMVDHNGEVIIFVDSELKVPVADYDASSADRIVFTAPFVGTEKVLVVAYQLVGSSVSGNGVKNIAQTSATVYTVTLENNQTYTINTATPIDITDLPPGIESMTVLPDGQLQVVLSDTRILMPGSVNSAISLVDAVVDQSGDLILETNNPDPAKKFINVGSVLSDLTISNTQIDQQTGHLIVTLSTGQTFDAGVTATYVTGAAINPADGQLQITLSNGTTFDAGIVRNPLMGTFYDFVCFQGQYEFPVAHTGYQVVVWARGVMLTGPAVDTSDPTKVVLRLPRDEADDVRIVLFTKAQTVATEMEGEAAAPAGSVYGRNPTTGLMGFWVPALTKFGVPNDFVATQGQAFFPVTHGGRVEVVVNGRYLMDNEYIATAGTSGVSLAVPLNANDRVRITAIIAPKPMGDFVVANYARVGHRTNSNGGSFVAGAWQIRSLNTIIEDNIGVSLAANRLILPAGKYYIKGWAACNGVSTNALRLYNQTHSKVVKEGPAVFASREFSLTFQAANCLTPIEGYFDVETQSAMLLQHKCLVSKSNYGFGVVGGGHSTSSGGSTNLEKTQADFGMPADLVDLQIWKVG